MLSRKEPQHVSGINEHQTSTRFSSLGTSSKIANFTDTSILRLQNSPQQQAISVKFTDDCFESLQRACQQNHEVLVHVDRKGITIEIKTSSSTSIKFDCYLQRVSGTVFRVLQRDQNAYNDIANISMRAQVKPTEKTFQTSREKAQVVSKHLEKESSKCKTQMLQGPIKPGNRKLNDFKSRITGKSSIPSPRNGSTLSTVASSSHLRLNPKTSPPMRTVKSSKDSPFREQIIHYIICGKFSTQNEIVDYILSQGLPSDVKSDTAKRKIREIICEVAEEYRNPTKLMLLPKYHDQVDLNWPFFSPEERSKAERALAETNLEAGINFAPLRASTRGPLMAPKAKTKKESTTSPLMNSSTTSPEIASDGSTCSTPSPVDQSQLNSKENGFSPPSSTQKRKNNLMENFKSAGFIDGSPPNKKTRTVVQEQQELTNIRMNKTENVIQPNGTEKCETKPKYNEQGKSLKSHQINDFSSATSDSFASGDKSFPDGSETDEKPLAKPVLKTEAPSLASSQRKLVDSGSKSREKDKEVSKIESKEEKIPSIKTESSSDLRTDQGLSAQLKKTNGTNNPDKCDKRDHKKEKYEKGKHSHDKIKEKTKDKQKEKSKGKEEKIKKPKELVDYTVPRKSEKKDSEKKMKSGYSSMDSKKTKDREAEKLPNTESKKPEKTKNPESEKLTMKTPEKLSKPINREVQKESNGFQDLKTIPLRELLGMFSDPVKPSKNYEQKYPPIKSKSDAKIYNEHELKYYELYEKAYNHLLTVQNDLRTLVERMNNAKTDSERVNLEEKIRKYATHCINDASYRNQRRTVANMTNAIQILRDRMDAFYSQSLQQHQ